MDIDGYIHLWISDLGHALQLTLKRLLYNSTQLKYQLSMPVLATEYGKVLAYNLSSS